MLIWWGEEAVRQSGAQGLEPSLIGKVIARLHATVSCHTCLATQICTCELSNYTFLSIMWYALYSSDQDCDWYVVVQAQSIG